VRTEERGEDPSTFSFMFIINLFKLFLLVYTNLIYYFMSGQKTCSFSVLYLPVFVNTERHLKVVSYQHVYVSEDRSSE
jgi:hypothetical protein